MGVTPDGPEEGPAARDGLHGCGPAPAGNFEHHEGVFAEERRLEERDDADAAHIRNEVEAGREPVCTHDQVWADDR